MAALAHYRPASEPGDSLRPTSLPRDLTQIAELVELCFGQRLDENGRAAVREMKAVGRLGPLLWILSILNGADALGLGTGYVWREAGRVVGNVSLYRGGTHPQLGRGWLIANVAVHPDYRRRGIARLLMDAGISLARRQRGRWVSLEVEDDNIPAVTLYRSLGFEPYEVLAQWAGDSITPPAPAAIPHGWEIRKRRANEVQAEADLIFGRARRGAIAWTRAIEQQDIDDGGLLREGVRKEHWVLARSAAPEHLSGVLWVELQSWRKARLTLFLDPDVQDGEARETLLRHALQRLASQGWSVRMETTADDPTVDDLLRASGFRRTRSLIQMRRQLTSGPEAGSGR